MPNDIGKRIKTLRTMVGLSQEELGRRVGVQRAAINKYEKGTVTNIPIHTIEQIAAIFEVSPMYLIGWSENGGNELAIETKLIIGVGKLFGEDAVELLELYTELTTSGKKKVLEYVQDLSRIEEYQEKE